MATTTKHLVATAATAAASGFPALHARVGPQVFLWFALQVPPALRLRLPLDDLVQEVWLRAFARFASYDSTRGPFRGWLLGVAKNVLREQLRSMRRMPTLAAPPQRVDPGTSVVGRLLRGERRDALLATIDGLDEIDRRICTWRGLEGLQYADIAARLGLGIDAVESRWRRLVGRLRLMLRAVAEP